MSREHHSRLVLGDLKTFFKHGGVDVYEQSIDTFDTHWLDETTCSNTMYLTDQFFRYLEAMRQPERNIHFAV
jgi:hypothetical protein